MELLFLCLRAAYPPIARSPALRVGLNSPARRLSTLTGRWGNRSALSPIRLPLLRPFSLQIQPNKYSVGCGDIARGARETRTVKAVGLLCLWPRAAAAVQDSRAARILARSFPPIPNEARPRKRRDGLHALSYRQKCRAPEPVDGGERPEDEHAQFDWMGRRRRARVAGCSATPGMMFWGRRVG